MKSNKKLARLRALTTLSAVFALATLAVAQEGQGASALVRKTGTVKSVSGNAIVLKADAGPDVKVTVQEGARIVRVAPGQTDLKSAEPMTLQEIQVGDRMAVRGKQGETGDSIAALSVIVMRQGDVAQKQQKDLQDWQRRGVGGIVRATDAATGSVVVDVNPTLTVTVKTGKDTGFLRYAPDSIKFADAQKSTFDQIKTGDQIRARGARSADGKEIAAEEVISGTFRNIAGTISGIDAAAGTVTVKDVLAKKTVTVRLGPESQMRKLPEMLAQRIAFFLKAPEAAQAAAASGGGPGGRGAGGAGPGSGRPGGPPDFQQMISRLPAVSLADLKKDEAVMIVSTPGTGGTEVTAITLLSGVEPIITASPSNAAALLSGWNLSAPGGEGGPQ